MAIQFHLIEKANQAKRANDYQRYNNTLALMNLKTFNKYLGLAPVEREKYNNHVEPTAPVKPVSSNDTQEIDPLLRAFYSFLARVITLIILGGNS